MIVDAHQHFWRIDRGVNDWITDEISGIRRDYLADHLRPYLTHLGVDRTVLVQASETLTENSFMVEMAQDAGFVGAIVAWLDLAAPEAGTTLTQLATVPLVRAIRPVLQGIDDVAWVLRDEVISNLRHAATLGLRFDALITPRHLPVIDRLAHLIPDLPIAINHAAKPVIGGGKRIDSLWRNGMAQLADHPQIHCKLSGLATEYGPGWAAPALQPVTDHLLACFGARRLMWGSDWPVLELDGSYGQWFSCVQQMIANLSQTDQAAILGGTAAAFYNIDPVI